MILTHNEKEIEIKPGMEFDLRGIRWDAGWEFDCPVVIIAPVYRFFEDGSSFEHATESLLIDACMDGKLRSQSSDTWEWRGWPEKYLKRKWYRKQKGVQKLTGRVRFILDEDGELFWEDLSFVER